MNEVVVTEWKGNMTFEAVIDGISVKMDADPQFGGIGFGARPKPMVLSSLAGCTGMDVISILTKKQVPVTHFQIHVNGELTETHPKYYKSIHVIFEVTGPGFEGDQSVFDKVQRAVKLSTENYCGVNAMLKNSCTITNEIILKNS